MATAQRQHKLLAQASNSHRSPSHSSSMTAQALGSPEGGCGGAGGHGGAGPLNRTRKAKSRGPRPRLFKKGECQADGCTANLTALPRYNIRNHICLAHKSADSFSKLGTEVRFCQRCGVSHPLKEYDGLKRSCRRMLALHNSRRRKTDVTSKAAAAPPLPLPQPALVLQTPSAQQEQKQEQEEQPAVHEQLPSTPPELASMQLGSTSTAALLLSGSSSPSASVGSAVHTNTNSGNNNKSSGSNNKSSGSGSRLLAGSSSVLAAEGASASAMRPPDLPPPFWDSQEQEQVAAAAVAPLEAAAPSAAAFDERVCCDGACGASCGACDDTCGAYDTCGAFSHSHSPSHIATAAAAASLDYATPAPASTASVAATAADSAAASSSGGAVVGCAVARAAAGMVGGGGGEDGGRHSSGFGPRPATVLSSSGRTAATQPATATKPRLLSQSSGCCGGEASTAAVAALARLRCQEVAMPALYQLLVKQQLAVAQALLIAAAAALSERLLQALPSAIPLLSAR